MKIQGMSFFSSYRFFFKKNSVLDLILLVVLYMNFIILCLKVDLTSNIELFVFLFKRKRRKKNEQDKLIFNSIMIFIV